MSQLSDDFSASDYIIRQARDNERLTIIQILYSPNPNIVWLGIAYLIILFIVFASGILYFSTTIIFLPAWDYIQIYGLNLGFSLTLIISSLCFFFLPALGLFYFWQQLNNQFDPKNIIVAVAGQQIIGFIIFFQKAKYAYLRNIFIKPEYRQKGIGSNLVKTIISKVGKPIYTDYYTLDQKYFLNRCGFEKRKFGGLRFWLNKISSIYPNQLVLYSNSQVLPTNSKSQTDQDSALPKYIIQKNATKLTEINYFLRHNFLHNTQDPFSPFGFNSIICFSPAILLLFIGEFLLILVFFLLVLLDFSGKVNAAIILLLIFGFILTSLSIKRTTNKLMKRPQFWLIKYKSRIVGYARFLDKGQYTILYHVYSLPSFQTETTPELITHLIQQNSQPIYAACTRKTAKQYYEHGFVKTPVNQIPQELQLGAKIAQKLGYVVLCK